MTFQSLGLIEALLKAVRLQGYKTPSTIQQKAIPPILTNNQLYSEVVLV